MSDHEPTIFHNTPSSLVYHFHDPSVFDYPSQSPWPQDSKKQPFSYTTYPAYPVRPPDTDHDEWSPSAQPPFSQFPHSSTATQAPITLSNHEPYAPQVKQEDLAIYSGFHPFDPNQSFGPSAAMHHVQPAQHQHHPHTQAHQQAWSPLTQPSPLTPSPPIYQQQLSPLPVPIHQPRPVVPQAPQSQAPLSSPHYSSQNASAGSPPYQTIDQVVAGTHQQPHHPPTEQQYIRPAEISPPESSATSVLSTFDAGYGFMAGPGSVGVESDHEGDYGPNATVTRSESGVWSGSGIAGTMGMALHDDDADGEDDDSYGTSDIPNDLMFQVQPSNAPQERNSIQDKLNDRLEEEDEQDDADGDDVDDSSDPEYAPNARARSHRPLTIRRAQRRHQTSEDSPYQGEGRSFRLRNYTTTRYSPYTGYRYPLSLYSYSSPDITTSSYPSEAGYGNSDDTLNGHRYATRTRRTVSDPVPYTGANGTFSSSYQMAITSSLDSPGVPGRRRSRPTNILPVPVPVPNLTKKSRGRRVPTVESLLVESEAASSTSNTTSAMTASGRVRRAAAPSRSMAETGSTVPSAKGRSFECTVEGCGKLFARGEHLKRHIRSIHTYEKPHQCPICGKDFSRHDNLNQHLRVHKGQAPSRGTISAGSGYRA
uniref:Transcription factor STE12 n=1 Tax=Volvariella volvacea TaxID=36659 RepID=R9WW93_9AGAR|nr:transcription factor STE12 [Volvariella volvacea]